jgi:hypothetical protein
LHFPHLIEAITAAGSTAGGFGLALVWRRHGAETALKFVNGLVALQQSATSWQVFLAMRQRFYLDRFGYDMSAYGFDTGRSFQPGTAANPLLSPSHCLLP